MGSHTRFVGYQFFLVLGKPPSGRVEVKTKNNRCLWAHSHDALNLPLRNFEAKHVGGGLEVLPKNINLKKPNTGITEIAEIVLRHLLP